MLNNIFSMIDPTPVKIGQPGEPLASGGLTPEQMAYLEMLSRPPQYQNSPAPTQPAWRTEDLLKVLIGGGLSAAIGGNEGAANFLGGYLGSKNQKAQDDTVFNQTQTQYENQRTTNQYNAGLNTSRARMDITDSNRKREEDAALKRELKAADTLQKQQVAMDKRIESARTLFQRARTLPEMQTYAKAWAEAERQSGAEIITAPTDEQVTAAFMQKSNAARNVIYDNWRQYVDSAKKDNYGMVLPGEAARLSKLKKDFEAELATYGITDAYLPDPPTEKSKLAEYKETMLQLAKDKGVELKDMNDQRILESKARVQNLKDRLDIAKRQAATGEKNAETNRLRQMDQELRKEVSQTNSAVDKKVHGLTADIEGLRKRQGLEASPSKRREIENQIQQLDGKRQYWASQREAEVSTQLPPPAAKGPDVSYEMSDGTKVRWSADK